MNQEEILCEEHFINTHSRNEEGRYIVALPFKNGINMPELGDSRKTAVATLLQLERRFNKNPNLRNEYRNFINEYLALGHMERAPYNVNSDKLIHYFPHHCVFKESTTTMLRVVFSGSQKTSNGKSLNDQLAIGNANQSDLISLLLNFRIYRYAFSSDVEKMYRQIELPENQRDLHRILWRNSPQEPGLSSKNHNIWYFKCSISSYSNIETTRK